MESFLGKKKERKQGGTCPLANPMAKIRKNLKDSRQSQLGKKVEIYIYIKNQ